MELTVGVIGAGTMGIGVSHAFAAAGHAVTLVDHDQAALDRARDEISRNLRLYGLVGGERVDADAAMRSIMFTTSLAGVAEAEFIVENVTEDWAVKASLYRELDAICQPRCVIGVNTSAIPITRLAALTSRAERIIGTHFMNPAPLKPLVEVIPGVHTSPESVAFTEEVIRSIGKGCAVVADSPGFVTNRVMMLMVNEAICLLHEGAAAATEIDRIFVECFAHRMGPLATADLIGLDTVLLSLEVLLDRFNDPKYRPSVLLRRYVDAGFLGVKSGRGFHTYRTPPQPPAAAAVTMLPDAKD